jgi:L-carnitine CoA-transferase
MVGYYPYKCQDGKYLFVASVGMTAMKDGMPFLGLAFPSEEYPFQPLVVAGTPGAKKFHARLAEFCAARTAEEAERELVAAGVPCSKVLNYEDAVEHPYYQARHVFMEWDDPQLRQQVKGVSPIPRFKHNPSRIWRGCNVFGADNDDILSEVGYSPEEIDALYENKIVSYGKAPAGDDEARVF